MNQGLEECFNDIFEQSYKSKFLKTLDPEPALDPKRVSIAAGGSKPRPIGGGGCKC